MSKKTKEYKFWSAVGFIVKGDFRDEIVMDKLRSHLYHKFSAIFVEWKNNEELEVIVNEGMGVVFAEEIKTLGYTTTRSDIFSRSK